MMFYSWCLRKVGNASQKNHFRKFWQIVLCVVVAVIHLLMGSVSDGDHFGAKQNVVLTAVAGTPWIMLGLRDVNLPTEHM